MAEGFCPIWGTAAQIFIEAPYQQIVISPRSGGHYTIIDDAIFEMTRQSFGNREKARLTTWLVDQRRSGVKLPIITKDVVLDVSRKKQLSSKEQFDRFFLYFTSKGGNSVRPIEINHRSKAGDADYEPLAEFCAWTELESEGDYTRFVQLIQQMDYVALNADEIYLSGAGCEKLDEVLSTNTDSKQVFVAQWFGGEFQKDEMDKLYLDGMSKGIEGCGLGLKAFRIDQKDHNGKICDEIIAEIRRSKLVVADFTCDFISHDGQSHPQIRGGVYYEAGFAHGLGLPVIFTCKKESEGVIHFDTRQYNHILWETHAELAEKLKQRIRATFNPN
jgi:hypothetical protein